MRTNGDRYLLEFNLNLNKFPNSHVEVLTVVFESYNVSSISVGLKYISHKTYLGLY